jgi:hypothetical protein
MLDDLGKNIQRNQRWALKDWVQGAKLLVIATDVHGLKGDDYVQFACAHLPIEGKTQSARARAAYELHLLGYAQDGQPANGDLLIQEYEAQAALRPFNFEWPHWRSVTKRLRREAQEREQGDGIPTGEDAEATADAKDGHADDAEDDPVAPIDPLAQMDSDNQKLRADLNAAQQRFKSERAAREEVADALARLQSDITRLLSANNEKALWESMPPNPTPEPPHTPRSQFEPEAALESPTDPPRTVGEAVNLVYRRRQTETCETVAETLRLVPMHDWERDDFERLKEALDGVADWLGNHNETAWTFFSFETSPILFGTTDGVLIYEDGLKKVLTWPQAMERIAPRVEEAKRKRELERRQQAFHNIMARTLPAKRKLKVAKALADEVMALQPTEIRPEMERAVDFVRAMKKDDERFAKCRTFNDYVRKALVITAPPKMLLLPPPELGPTATA